MVDLSYNKWYQSRILSDVLARTLTLKGMDSEIPCEVGDDKLQTKTDNI